MGHCFAVGISGRSCIRWIFCSTTQWPSRAALLTALMATVSWFYDWSREVEAILGIPKQPNQVDRIWSSGIWNPSQRCRNHHKWNDTKSQLVPSHPVPPHFILPLSHGDVVEHAVTKALDSQAGCALKRSIDLSFVKFSIPKSKSVKTIENL